MTFTQILHDLAEESWTQSKQHPFVQELVKGSLPLEKFRYYLIQDAYYLKHFANAHQEVINRTDSQRIIDSQRFCKEGLEESELLIRQQFFKELQITEEEVNQTAVAPTAYHYTSHIYRQFAEGILKTALVALLPCYWLYYEIGVNFSSTSSPVKIYQEFLETYDSEGFKEVLEELIRLVDELAETASEEECEAMKKAFLISSYCELNFWQMAYTQETWESFEGGIRLGTIN